ncbi:MAG: hypothetical protein JO354_13020 [Verrucomicrobia bacterium]|nr:hypothetical protein [Verrucomicrobiota bacterium]
MKDSVARGRLLQLLFERRNEGPLPFGDVEGAVQPAAGINPGAWLHALAQLAEYDLVSWKPFENQTVKGSMSGFAEITENGVNVCCGRQTPDINIRFC